MRPRTLLALLVVVAALAAFIWFYERELPSSEEREERAKRVLGVEAAEVQAVEIAWEGRQVRLERVGESAGEPIAEGGDAVDSLAVTASEWRLVAPLEARADAAAVDRLVDSLVSLERERTLEEVDLADVGLEEPRGRVTLETAAGRSELRVGGEVPASSSMVVAVGDRDEAYVVPAFLWDDLTREPEEWRSREVFPGDRGDVERLAVTPAAGARLVLARRGDEFWLEAPWADRADEGRVNRLFGELEQLRVEDFLSAAEAAAALAAPAVVLEAQLAGEEAPFRLTLGEAAPRESQPPATAEEPPAEEARELRYARVEAAGGEQAITLTTGLAALLAVPAEQWRSRSWTGHEVFEMDRLRVTDAGGTIVLERADGDWKRDGVRISYEPVSDLLFAVTSAEAEAVIGVEEARRRGALRGEPLVTLAIVTGEEEGEEETLTLYAPQAGAASAPAGKSGPAAARQSGREAVLLLPADVASEVTAALAAVRAAAPLADEAGTEAGTEG